MTSRDLPPLRRGADDHAGSPLLRLRRSAPGRAATEAARTAIRTFGQATAGQRVGPEVLVIGAKRGGTTSFWRYFAQHPGVLPMFPRQENLKGTYFFDEEYARGTSWYLAHFASRSARARAEAELGYAPITFEACPYYLYHPLAPARAHQLLPGALVLALLRDPVERTYSHWKERRHHTEDLSFEDALAAEADRTAGEAARILADPTYVSLPHRHQSYVDQSRYAPMLERWFAAYGRHQVLAVPAEEFYADPQALLDRVCARVGLPPHPIADLEPFNAEPSPGMDPATRTRLRDLLTPDIEATEALLGRSLPWARGDHVDA